MANASLGFDHVHLVAKDPHATARWYVEKLGGEIARSAEVKGAPQVYVSFNGFIVIVRGQRPAETAASKETLQWGVDHFGLRVRGDFDGFCADSHVTPEPVPAALNIAASTRRSRTFSVMNAVCSVSA